LRMEAGTLHGVLKGGEISVHEHNYCGSHNPSIASLLVLEVHPTWSKCTPLDPKAHLLHSGEKCWGLVTRWHPRRSLSATLTTSSLRKSRSTSPFSARQPTGDAPSIELSISSTEAELQLPQPNHIMQSSKIQNAPVQPPGLNRFRRNLRDLVSASVHRFDFRLMSKSSTPSCA
jgi:hypothetical protein